MSRCEQATRIWELTFGTARGFLGFLLGLLAAVVCHAQCSDSLATCAQAVPHLVKFNGSVKTSSLIPRAYSVAMRFVVYDQSTGGTPLWQETQMVQIDQSGHYEVVLGAAAQEGVPTSLFSAGEPRWLGTQVLPPGEGEESRVLLVSVPYALQAADAQTLGGLPASAFVRAPVASGVPSTTANFELPSGIVPLPAQNTPITSEPVDSVASAAPNAIRSRGFFGTANTVPKYSARSGLIDSQIKDEDGVVTVQNMSNILYAERFPDGVASAVAACPANGCIIYATSPKVSLNLGAMDPGAKAITIYLGPYTYTVKQITLRSSLKIIGMGSSDAGTILQSVNGNSPVFVIPQTSNTPAVSVQLSNFRLFGSSGNTSEDGFFLDTSSTVNSGLWFSTLENIYMEGFAGIAMHVRGPNNGFQSLSQWVLLHNVVAFRTPGGANGLRMEGAVFQWRLVDCQFDGQATGDGTNIFIGGLQGGIDGYPLSITFEGLVTQAAATGVQIDGVNSLTFHGSHHEKLLGAYQVNTNFNIWTKGLTISDSYFAGDVGLNNGAGYILNVTTSLAAGVNFSHNQVLGNPDAVVMGTNLSSVNYQDNLYGGSLSVPPTTGITWQIDPAAIINIQGAHSVGLNPSTTPIATVQSSLGPGEMVTFFTPAGPAIFAASSNINLMGADQLTVNGSITFLRTDLPGGFQWTPVAQWTAPASPAPPAGASSKKEPAVSSRYHRAPISRN